VDEVKVLVAAPVLVAVLLAASACASSRGGSEPAPMPGTVPSTTAQKAIARVLASEDFGFFPNDEVSSGCRIPTPVRRPGIKGTCQTRVSFEHRSQATVVTFTESWPSQRFKVGKPPFGRTLHHAWSFEVKRNGTLVSLGNHGDFPPQEAMGPPR
jgi:hypothetical protein